MTNAVIVLNAGSTSVKFGAYDVDGSDTLQLLCRGQVESVQGDPHFVANGANGKPLHAHRWGAGHAIDHKTDLQYVITWLESNAPAA